MHRLRAFIEHHFTRDETWMLFNVSVAVTCSAIFVFKVDYRLAAAVGFAACFSFWLALSLLMDYCAGNSTSSSAYWDRMAAIDKMSVADAMQRVDDLLKHSAKYFVCNEATSPMPAVPGHASRGALDLLGRYESIRILDSGLVIARNLVTQYPANHEFIKIGENNDDGEGQYYHDIVVRVGDTDECVKIDRDPDDSDPTPILYASVYHLVLEYIGET